MPMAINPDWISILKKVPLFTGFTGKELHVVAKKMNLISFPKGATLVKENTPGDTFYCIVSGSARLVKANPSAKDHIDKYNTVAFIGRGDCIGEISLMTGENYPYSVLIESTADVLSLKKEDFDHLLESLPSLAVHVSRNLSSHLAYLSRKEATPMAPTKIITVIPALPYHEQILFGINLGISLVEQTRQRTLLFFVDDENKLAARSLGLEQSFIYESALQTDFLTDLQKFEKLVMVHPSGLEFLSLHKKIFHSLRADLLENFLSLVRDLYDTCLFVLPVEFTEQMYSFVQGSTHVLFVTSKETPKQDFEVLEKAQQALPSARPKEQIFLVTDPSFIPVEIPVGNRIPWDSDWARSFIETRSPFIPFQAVKTQMKFDRLARYLSQRLIGFAMGSGAAYGYSLIGMLRILEREGIRPDVVQAPRWVPSSALFIVPGSQLMNWKRLLNHSIKNACGNWLHLGFRVPES